MTLLNNLCDKNYQTTQHKMLCYVMLLLLVFNFSLKFIIFIDAWAKFAQFMILFYLSWKLLQQLLCQQYPITLKLVKLYKLNQIPLSLISMQICHLAIIII